jgi:hypothetical protein
VYQQVSTVAAYFATHPGTPQQVRIRGGDAVVAVVGSARMYVCAHQTKRFVIALKYEGEETYRYLIASELSWRTLDIVQAHTLRWLVEIFVQDTRPASSEARNTATHAISSGCPNRPSGVCATSCVSRSLPMIPIRWRPSVSTPSGAMVLTRIFLGPYSLASTRVIESTALLVAA